MGAISMGWAFEPKVIATRNPPFEVLVVVQGTPCLRVTATVVYNKLFFKWGNKDSFTLLLRAGHDPKRTNVLATSTLKFREVSKPVTFIDNFTLFARLLRKVSRPSNTGTKTRLVSTMGAAGSTPRSRRSLAAGFSAVSAPPTTSFGFLKKVAGWLSWTSMRRECRRRTPHPRPDDALLSPGVRISCADLLLLRR